MSTPAYIVAMVYAYHACWLLALAVTAFCARLSACECDARPGETCECPAYGCPRWVHPLAFRHHRGVVACTCDCAYRPSGDLCACNCSYCLAPLRQRRHHRFPPW